MAPGKGDRGREREISFNTLRIDKERLPHILKRFGRLRVCEISVSEIREYQRERSKLVSNKTVNLETTVLRMILQRAGLWQRIAPEFRPLPEKRSTVGRALSPDEEKTLFEIASAKPLWTAAYLAALVAANTTARGCELKQLRLRDVDIVKGTFTIWRKTTKTDAGQRVIPMNANANWAFTQLIERAQLLGSTEPDHFLFPRFLYKSRRSPSATALGYDPTQCQKSWRTAWRSLTAAAGLKAFRFHDLRHHSITRLAEAGVPDQTIMSIAGHVSEDMLRHYSSIREKARREAVALIESYIPRR